MNKKYEMCFQKKLFSFFSDIPFITNYKKLNTRWIYTTGYKTLFAHLDFRVPDDIIENRQEIKEMKNDLIKIINYYKNKNKILELQSSILCTQTNSPRTRFNIEQLLQKYDIKYDLNINNKKTFSKEPWIQWWHCKNNKINNIAKYTIYL